MRGAELRAWTREVFFWVSLKLQPHPRGFFLRPRVGLQARSPKTERLLLDTFLRLRFFLQGEGGHSLGPTPRNLRQAFLTGGLHLYAPSPPAPLDAGRISSWPCPAEAWRCRGPGKGCGPGRFSGPRLRPALRADLSSPVRPVRLEALRELEKSVLFYLLLCFSF